MNKPSSKDFLESILSPHIELSLSLLNLVKSTNTDDPTHRFQIAAIVTFLSGIDKVLSLTYQLLYIAGKISWKEIAPNKNRTPIGNIECQWGLTKKIRELKNFGVDISDLQSIIDLRNMYMHDSYIYVGYAMQLDHETNQPYLGGTELSHRIISPPITYFTPEYIHYYEKYLLKDIGKVLDKTDWFTSWKAMSKKLEQLPKNPEPQFSQLLPDYQNLNEIIQSLNEQFIGNGAIKLLFDDENSDS